MPFASLARCAVGATGLLLVVLCCLGCTDRVRAAGHVARAATAPSCPALKAGTTRLSVDPARVPVDLHVPTGGVAAGARLPVVVVLGGVNQPGRDIAQLTDYSRLADAKHALVAYPTARGGARVSWDFASAPDADDADVAYLRAVIHRLTGPGVCGDPTRVMLTGMSNGGGMAARMACSAADLLAADAPVSGGYSTLPDCAPARRLPLLEIHGSADPIVPYNGKGPAHAGAVDAYVAGWRTRDGCPAAATMRTVAGTVTQSRWRCAAGTVVENDRVAGVGHDWAGERSEKPFSATVATWEFLSAFRNPGAAASMDAAASTGTTASTGAGGAPAP